ncbi:unnamed protein product [Alopecurus aequalis]
MGRPEHSHGEDRLPFSPSPPLSSPSPLLLPGNAKKGGRRHAIARLIRSPFAAVFRTAASARASATPKDNQVATKRPSLEDLLRMEAPSNLDPEQPNEADKADDPGWKQSAIVVFEFGEDGNTSRTEDEEEEEAKVPPLAIPGNEKQTAILPAEEFGLGHPAAGLGAGAPTVLMNVERLVLVLAARSRALKGSYGRVAGRQAGGAAADKAESLFYDRPIPLGRRCRVKHLQETPYF